MLTANIGLHEVAHVHAPAGIDELAHHVQVARVAGIDSPPISFIPGIKTVPPQLALDRLHELDMLRGEESESFGILKLAALCGPLHILLPGSHTKLVRVDEQNRISYSYTTLAGELMQAMAERTVLANSIDWPPDGAPRVSALEAGARFVRAWGLLRGGFAVRLADVILGLDRCARTWFFVGLVVASDLGDLARWLQEPRASVICVGGREPLRSAYGHLLHSEWQVSAHVLDEPTVANAPSCGALAIARRARELQCSAS
jgi:2-dehydro-3-deoxygalactonokinase